MIDQKKIAKLAGAAATATVAIGLLSTGAANADTFIPMPDDQVTEVLPDGTEIHIRLTGQSANISPSMGSTPVHRNAWVSAHAEVEITNGENLGGAITPGYVVGCQVQINGGAVNGGASGTAVYANNSTSGNGTGGFSLSLGPGQAQAFNIIDREKANGFGADQHVPYNDLNGNHGGIGWKDTTIGLTGCAGYAQARVFVKAEIETRQSHGVAVIWGPPFSLG